MPASSLPEPQTAEIGDLVLCFDGFNAELSARDIPEDETVRIAHELVADLVDALDRHDGMWLSSPDYLEDRAGNVHLSWFDYDEEERPVGGGVTIFAEHVPAVRAWLAALPLPVAPTDTRIAELAAQRAAERRMVREERQGGLPDTLDFEGSLYRLNARDEHGVGLYRLAGGADDNELLWLTRAADGALTPSGRPVRPDRHGRARAYRHPRAAGREHWLWVRTPPPRQR